jgi:alkylhydroperoxidase family enzyme
MRTGRPVAKIELSSEVASILQGFAQRRKTAQALALRARIVLGCAAGLSNKTVAARERVTAQTASKWRRRFVERGVDGLLDEPRPGAHERGGKHHLMPCHHTLAEVLHAYISAAGIAEDRKGFLFRTSSGHKENALSDQPTDQSAAWRMIRRRAVAAGIHAPIGNHIFRATGITAYLSNGGALEHARKWPHMRARARPSSTIARKSG